MMKGAAIRKTRMIGVRQAIAAGMAIFAILFMWLGLSEYGFWDEFKGPRPGFFPVIIAVVMLAISIVTFVFSFKEPSSFWPAENWLVPLSVLGIIGATFIIGLLPSIGLYVLLWLKGFEKCSWKTTLITFSVIMGIVIGAFVLWLEVPFPKGLILNAILY